LLRSTKRDVRFLLVDLVVDLVRSTVMTDPGAFLWFFD